MKKTYLLDGLCCANCAAKIERDVAKLDGVKSANVSFLTTKMVLELEDELEADFEKKLKKIVKKTEPDVEVEEI